mgnify:CR=1 FL=1
MNDAGFDEPAEERFRELTDLFQRHPLAYAGYRISHLQFHDRDISESGEIPFVTSPLFPVVIAGYLVLSRLLYLGRVVTGDADSFELGSSDHVFSMTSTRGYRTHTFLDVAQSARERGESVVLLCSPAAASEREDWEADGYRTVTHRELHGRVGVLAVFRGLVTTLALTRKLRATDDVEPGLGNALLYYNFVLLELVKRESVRPLTERDPSIHTFSPMPYLIDATESERVFVYQHGIQPPLGDKIMAAPFFAPLTYLLWGDPWQSNFRAYVHSGADLRTVGSPWYEHLAEKRRDDRDPSYDVLFVSGSHGLTDDEIERQFERLVDDTVRVCEDRGYSLAVKLHPLEDRAWFDERGYGEYVTEFDDIDDALLDSRVAVTNASTAFVESAVLGVPVVVSDLWDYGLSALAPVDYVRFTDGPDVGAAVADAVEGSEFRSDESRPLVSLGNARERILDVVDEKRGR